MRWSLSLGTIAGIRVQLHVTFLILVGWIALQGGLLKGRLDQALDAVVLLLLVFACVLLHELGHALTARRYGIQTRDITLLPIGGVARLTRMPEKPQQEIAVAVAGPAVNVVIAIALAVVSRGLDRPLTETFMRGDILASLLVVNVVMILFNMIPAFPMDGGRVLRAALALRLPYERATRIASTVGQGMAILFGIAGVFGSNPMLMVIALFVFLAAGEEQAQVQTRATISGLAVSAAMVTEFHTLDAGDPLRRAVDHLMAGSQQDFPVTEGGAYAGVLSRADLVSALKKRGAEVAVGAVLRADGEHLGLDEPLEEALQRMRGGGYTALPVLRDGRLVGLLTLDNVGDLLLVREALRRYAGDATA